MSTSRTSSSASALCGSHEGMCRTSPARHVHDLRLVLAQEEAQGALEDVGQLLVLVRVLRDDAALVQVHVGEHHPLGRDQAPVEVRLQLLFRHVLPAVSRGSRVCSRRLLSSLRQAGIVSHRRRCSARDDAEAQRLGHGLVAVVAAVPGAAARRKRRRRILLEVEPRVLEIEVAHDSPRDRVVDAAASL